MSRLSEPALRAIGKAFLGALGITVAATLAPQWFKNPMSVAMLSAVLASVVGPWLGAAEPSFAAADPKRWIPAALLAFAIAIVSLLSFGTTVSGLTPTLATLLALVQFLAYAFRDEMAFRALGFSLVKRGAIPPLAALAFGILAPVAVVFGEGGSLETAALRAALGLFAGAVWMSGGTFWSACAVTLTWTLLHDVMDGAVVELGYPGRLSYVAGSGRVSLVAAALLSIAALVWMKRFSKSGFTNAPNPPKRVPMASPTLWHNPGCSKSRKAAELLAKTSGLTTRLYLEDPPSVNDLRDVIAALGISADELVRKKESVYTELELAGASEEQLLTAMSEHPVLIERPIFIVDGRAVIGRPPESVLSLLADDEAAVSDG